MNNSELVSRIASALIKGDMYERVSYCFLLICFLIINLFEHSLKYIHMLARSYISFQLVIFCN